MNVAAIDIGTNTVLMLIAARGASGEIIPLAHQHRIPRLGAGVDSSHTLSAEAIGRVIGVLHEYRSIAAHYEPVHAIVCATSAVRDAANSVEFLSRVREATGFDVEVLSGDDEALWTYRGVAGGLPGAGRATVLDIGGGSTEIVVGDRTRIHERVSLDVGAVRLTERIFRHDPPAAEEVQLAAAMAEEELRRADRFPFRGTSLIGVAGTVTSLAVLAQELPEFRLEAVSGYRLTAENVEHLWLRLSALPSRSIRQLSGIMEGRADVITAGTLILRAMMRRFAFPFITVSERGVRYGLVERFFKQQEQPS